ncbi:SAM-dependent methyltransferase [Sulfolobales Mexican rudivirus 1]|uniref:SAM-dependent methyltransferase n=1 Tax=Sulfolobales Mexican rod-shaped virus 1 TaxID=2848122 RepID=K4NX87_9VIRU|nr:SAM-dependent methyltransferase [Sulfolobales Mexican rudivirus 1]AFV51256.1 putative SAM-dependent methyltransferase [Sulfolobales Mexican rod-shaped virus 1]
MTDYNEYFAKLGCNYWREYRYAYRPIDFRLRNVIMIGADCGSSALYALSRGASRVIAYEKEEKLRKLFAEKVCKEFNICDKVDMRGEWSGKEYPPADVFLMDCEGCEDALDVTQLAKFDQWCIAIHDWAKRRVELLRALAGNTLTYISDDGKEIMVCGGED